MTRTRAPGHIGLHLEPQRAARTATDDADLVAAETHRVEPIDDVAQGERAALEQRPVQVGTAVVERQAARRRRAPGRSSAGRSRRRASAGTSRRPHPGGSPPRPRRPAAPARGPPPIASVNQRTLPPDTNPGFSTSQTRGSAWPCVSTRPVSSMIGVVAATQTGSAVPVMSITMPGRIPPAPRRRAVLVARADHDPGGRRQAEGRGRTVAQRPDHVRGRRDRAEPRGVEPGGLEHRSATRRGS